MLIVARRKGQRILIGGDIEVVVTDISRGEIRLGIIAPPEIPVVRMEVREAVEAANRSAAASQIGTESNGAAVVVGDLDTVRRFSSSLDAATRT